VIAALAGVRAVLLDMDGTLVDSDGAVNRTWLNWARRYGIDGASVLAIAHGNVPPTTIRHFAPHLSDAEVAADARHQLELEYDDLDGVVPNPGAHRLLAVLAERGLPWAVVTSADDRLAKARLTAASISPPVLITVEDVVHGKPDPEGYLMAAGLLGVGPADCLVVEDSGPGVAAGQAAGMRVAALKGQPADFSIAGLDELSRWLRP
jgi:HAD superfamily hydrolase (TIGR01509 family)